MKAEKQKKWIKRLKLLTIAATVLAGNGRCAEFAQAGTQYRGDVNQDGVVNLKDVTLLRRILSEGDGSVSIDSRIMDVNGDGVVNLKDITYLRRYLAGGWNIELPEIPQETVTPEPTQEPEPVEPTVMPEPTSEPEPIEPSVTPEPTKEPDQGALSEDLQNYEILTTTTSTEQVTCTSFRYGTSTQGRDLVCWSIQQGSYDRTVFLNFEIHGWEDEYAKDGQLLVDLGNYLVDYFSKQDDLHQCRLLIIPSCNPDGLAEGVTNNGFGRCNAEGIDLNRDFDASHVAYTSGRNYTLSPFSAVETRAMRDLVQTCHPTVVIDFHGWENCTIGSCDLAEVFSTHVGINHKKELMTNAHGYFSYWAQLQGAEALLVEFKNSASLVQENVAASVEEIVKNNYGQKQNDYELAEAYQNFQNIQCYAASDGKVYVQSAVGETGTGYGYIDGASDLCTISQIYANGWCKVKYPAGSAGYTKTGYCKTTEFIDETSQVTPYQAKVSETVKVYRTAEGTTQLGSVWSTDTFTVVAKKGGMAQIIYPLDNGGYKMGWLDESKIQE